jgi:hypothetical protein
MSVRAETKARVALAFWAASALTACGGLRPELVSLPNDGEDPSELRAVASPRVRSSRS